jgi:hypothetical protein
MRRLIRILCLFFVPSVALALDAPISPYAQLEYLAGSCWQGELAGGKDVDTHCFSWVYGGKFLRDQHVVHGAGHADYLGESIYFYDAATRTLQYLYIENGGGSSLGTVQSANGALLFPETSYMQDGQAQVYRSRWERKGDDGYEVITEFKNKDTWTPGFSAHMRRVQASSH